MNEFDPTKREYINMSPLHRLDSDVFEVGNHIDLYSSLMKYLSSEFNIPEDKVQLIFSEDENILPTAELYEKDPELAREQALLVLIKVALPLAENFIEDNASFIDWTIKAASVAMNVEGSIHQIEECTKVYRADSAPHSCSKSRECPVKFTAYKLIEDAAKIDYDSPDYLDPWVEQKIERTIAKVQVAKDLKLIEDVSASYIVQSYLRRCHTPRITSPL